VQGEFLSPFRCRAIAFALLMVGFVGHLFYLTVNPPIDLSGDEAQYWEWSRSLDLSYYSKGPLVAYIIRASCELFGEKMWAIRLPALLIAVATSVLTYWLTRRLFSSHKLALGAVALTHTVPLFVAGGMLMTIDPPFYFCWAATTCLAVKAIFDHSRFAWFALGLMTGVGLLAKYAMPLWYVGLFVFLILDPASRRWLRTPWPYLAVLITISFFTPAIMWNIQNDWVTFKHVARQTGVTQKEGNFLLNPIQMLAIQFGVIGPLFAIFMVQSVWAFARRTTSFVALGVLPDEFRALKFLVCLGGSFFAMVLLLSLRAEIEPNWPAPAYFTLTIVVAWWIGKNLLIEVQKTRLRPWLITHVVFGLVSAALLHQTQWLYAPASRLGIHPRKFDAQLVKMRGNEEFGIATQKVLDRQQAGTFVIARAYQEAALLAFYMPGKMRVYHIGSYLHGIDQTRASQWDIWPDTNLLDPALIGHDAVVFGDLDQAGVIASAFESIEEVDRVIIVRQGVEIRQRPIFVGKKFKGVTRPQKGSF